MGNTPQRRAVDAYRSRLKRKGLTRFEVVGLEADRELIRSLARKLAEGSADAQALRTNVRESISGTAGKGGVLAALRRSPLVGEDIDLDRVAASERSVEL